MSTDLCPARVGTPANHCWHPLGYWSDERGTHKSEKCCYCGVYETTDIIPQGAGSSTAYVLPKHGPHVPPVTVTW